MSRYKHPSKKNRMIKAQSNTKWAPYFAIFKKYGVGKKMHPSQLSKKRSWRLNKLKL